MLQKSVDVTVIYYLLYREVDGVWYIFGDIWSLSICMNSLDFLSHYSFFFTSMLFVLVGWLSRELISLCLYLSRPSGIIEVNFL